MNFNVYVIHSARPLPELKRLLDECGGHVYAGIIYKSLRHKQNKGSGQATEKEETKKTIVFCPESTVNLLELNYPIYKEKIMPYNWSSFPMPNTESGEGWDLHISGVPKDYTVRDAETLVTDSLSCVLAQSSGGRENFTVDFTPRLRETGEIYGFGHIKFANHVDRDTIKLCKLVLHNTPVGSKSNPKERRMITCIWHRMNNPSRQVKTNNDNTYVKRGRPASISQIDVSSLNDEDSSGVVSAK